MMSYWRAIKYTFQAKSFVKTSGDCTACGQTGASFEYFDVINDRLAKEWSIGPELVKAFSQRESMHCSNCRCSARSRAHAKAILLALGSPSPSLREAIAAGEFNEEKIKIAEINACGDLHQTLKEIKGLAYSEYGPRAIDNIQDEDLQALTYPDDSFDVVLTSDTFEHIPDYPKAFSEIYRVLRPSGKHIFTVPVIFSRPTRRRVELRGDDVVNIMEASYHGAGEEDNLVCTEFGVGILDDLRQAGFETDVYFANPFNKNEVNCVLVSKKPEEHTHGEE